jgi:hypothetical protein
VFRVLSIWLPPPHPAKIESLHEINPPWYWQELESRKHKMRLNREIQIGSLYKIPLAYSLDLLRHFAHIFHPADVLDDRVGIHDVKLPVPELVHISGITDNAHNVRIRSFNGLCIEQRNPDIVLAYETNGLPNCLSAAHIQNIQGPETFYRLSEPLIPSIAHSRCKGIWITIVSELSNHGILSSSL